MQVLIINGPNLNLTGIREPEVYGHTTLDQIIAGLRERAGQAGVEISHTQTNHEGAIIDALHGAMGRFDGIIINPGALAHYSYSLRDAITACEIPTVEVHMSNIASREEFRATSVIAPVCRGTVYGFGGMGYYLALEYFINIKG